MKNSRLTYRKRHCINCYQKYTEANTQKYTTKITRKIPSTLVTKWNEKERCELGKILDNFKKWKMIAYFSAHCKSNDNFSINPHLLAIYISLSAHTQLVINYKMWRIVTKIEVCHFVFQSAVTKWKAAWEILFFFAANQKLLQNRKPNTQKPPLRLCLPQKFKQKLCGQYGKFHKIK